MNNLIFRRYLTLFVTGFLLFGMAQRSWAQGFSTYFEDRTLRLDYIFSGNRSQQMIAFDQASISPKWYGKRQHLAELPMEGNGQITVRTKDGTAIYRNSFSTLFQEWLTYDASINSTQAFENVFLVPFPKDTVSVTVDIRNNRREVTATLTHTIVPSDILIRHIGEKGISPYDTLQAPADTSRCINIAFIAEGYTQEEMPLFLSDAYTATEAIFAHEPFKQYRERFNIVAVKTPSLETGTSEPGNGIWKQTALMSQFDTFYSQRYLTTLHLKRLHDLLAGIPYEHIIVLVNTQHYGGGGILNSYNLAMTRHPLFKPVVVHEFGHSFAGLADEYAYDSEPIPMYPLDVEPWEPNITTLANFHGKWENMIDNNKQNGNGVSLYEGAGYSLKGIYRGAEDCRMRTNSNPEFCPVCRQAISKLIEFYTE